MNLDVFSTAMQLRCSTSMTFLWFSLCFDSSVCSATFLSCVYSEASLTRSMTLDKSWHG